MKRKTLAAAAALILAAAGVRAASLTVDQSGQQFSEKSVALKAGESLVFANHDDVTHNVNVIDSNDDAIDLGLQKPGESLTYKFDKNGKFKIRCSIHPSMKMSVSVN